MGFIKKFHRGLTDFKKGFKIGFTTVMNPVVRGVRGVMKVGHHIDTLLNAAKHIPVVGEIASDIQASPEYHTFSGVLDSGSDILDRGVRYGNLIDQQVDKFLGSVEKLENTPVDQGIDDVIREGRQVVGTIRSGAQNVRRVIDTVPMSRRLFGV